MPLGSAGSVTWDTQTSKKPLCVLMKQNRLPGYLITLEKFSNLKTDKQTEDRSVCLQQETEGRSLVLSPEDKGLQLALRNCLLLWVPRTLDSFTKVWSCECALWFRKIKREKDLI